MSRKQRHILFLAILVLILVTLFLLWKVRDLNRDGSPIILSPPPVPHAHLELPAPPSESRKEGGDVGPSKPEVPVLPNAPSSTILPKKHAPLPLKEARKGEGEGAARSGESSVRNLRLDMAVSPEEWDPSWRLLETEQGTVDIYLGNPPEGFDLGQIVISKTELNGTLAPGSYEVLSTFGKFSGPVLHFKYKKSEAVKSILSGSEAPDSHGKEKRIELTGPLIDRERGLVARFSAERTVMLRDTLPPFTAISPLPPPSSRQWNNTPVSLTFRAVDSGTGVKETRYRTSADGGNSWSEWTLAAPASGSDQGSTEYESKGGVLSADGTYIVEYRSADLAGNEEPARQQIIKIDLSPPAFKLKPFLSSYTYNSYLHLSFDFNDSLSGIEKREATFNGVPVKNGASILLNHAGLNNFSLSAVDMAGNSVVQRATVNVHYRFTGFLPPLSQEGKGLFVFGSTIPIRFQITDVAGTPVSTAEASVNLRRITLDIPPGDPVDATPVKEKESGDLFLYDVYSGQYYYYLETRSLTPGTWRADVSLDDGTIHTLMFGLK